MQKLGVGMADRNLPTWKVVLYWGLRIGRFRLNAVHGDLQTTQRAQNQQW